MATVTNQYGTFETDKLGGRERLPVTAEQESIAQKLYGKSFKDLPNSIRTNIRRGKVSESLAGFSFEEYLEDYKNMANDPDYIPKYIKPGRGTGLPAQQIRARAEAKKTIPGFEEKFKKNVNKRKRLKREADPIKREKDLVAKAERRSRRRLKKQDVALAPREKKINLDQRAYARTLNKPIKDNPLLVLNDKDLIERLSISVSEDGDIIKKSPGLTKDFLKKRGLFEIEHQRDIFKKGRGKDLPYNRNLIAGPYNRAGGFKEMAEKFIEKNPDPSNSKVQNILKVAEDLKITIRPDVPEGTFSTKALGYKQLADPIEKFKDVGEKFVSENFLANFIAKVKSVPGGCRAVVTRALGGPIDKCEAIIMSDPEKAATKLTQTITATKGPLKDLKEDSQKLIRLYRGEGFNLRTGPSIKEMAKTFGVSEAEAKKKLLSGQWFTSDPVAAASYTNKLGKTKFVDVTPKEFMDFKRYVERVNKTKSLSGGERFPVGTQDKLSIVPRYKLDEFEKAGKLKSQRNIFKDFTTKSGYMERAEGVLSYDSVKGGFVDPADPTTIVNQDQIKAWAEANPEKVTAGTEAVEAATNKSVLSNVAKSLARVGAPLPVAAIDSYFIGKQVADGKGTAEIASNPLNWLGLATMEPLAKVGGIAEPGKLNAILRLGLNPATIRGITRFAGLPGLAISTAMTAYDQYQKYKDGEGFIFNLLNQKGTE